MGDIYCRNCGEPWDAYGVRHGDMTEEEAETFLAGKGCPCCKGKPVYDCKLESELLSGKPDCDYFDCGRCVKDGECENKVRRQRRDEEFLSSLTDSDNTDEDSIDLLSKVKL